MWVLDHKEGWMLKNCCFQIVVLEKTRESLGLQGDQSTLKEISPKYSLEGLILKLKLLYFGHVMWRANSLEKTLILGKTEGRRRRGQWRMRWLDAITDWMNMNLSKLWEMVKDGEARHAAVHGVTKSDMNEQLNSNKQVTARVNIDILGINELKWNRWI